MHFVVKSCTTPVYRWLFRDSLSSLRILWPAVIKHQNVLLWARLYQHVFCKKPLSFSSSSRYHNLGPSESAYIHCAYPNLVPLLLAAPLEVHETNWKCLDFLVLAFPKALLKYFHQPNSLWIPVANQAIHAIYLSVLLQIHQLFLWIFAAGVPEALHSYLYILLVLDFQYLCFLC